MRLLAMLTAAGAATATAGEAATAGAALGGRQPQALRKERMSSSTFLDDLPSIGRDEKDTGLEQLLDQLQTIESEQDPTMLETALDSLKLLAITYALADYPSETIKRLGNSLAHITENFEDKRVLIAGILSIIFGEAKTLADFKNILTNIKDKKFFPLHDIVKDKLNQNQDYILPKTPEDFAKILSESLFATGLKEEEKNKLLSLVHAMHVPNALTKEAVALLSAVERNIFPSHFCQGFLPTQQAKNEILKFLKPDDTQPLTKESLEQKIREIFQNETQKNRGNCFTQQPDYNKTISRTKHRFRNLRG